MLHNSFGKALDVRLVAATNRDLEKRVASGESHALASNVNPEDEARAIRKALEQAGGNKTEAARLLGMSRRTIYRKLKKLGMDSGG